SRSDRRAGARALPRGLPRRGRTLRGAEPAGAQFPAPRLARWRRHGVAADRCPGQDARPGAAGDGDRSTGGAAAVSAPLRVERDGDLVRLTLDDPARANALSPALAEALIAEFRRDWHAEGVRAVLLA